MRVAAIWTLAVVIGLLFVLIGLSKIAGPSADHWAERLSHWGYPAAARYVIGAVEMLAGLGVLFPQLRRPAAIALMVMMSGALVTHVVHGEFFRVISPLILGGAAYGLYTLQGRHQKA